MPGPVEPAGLRAVLFDAVGTLIELREPVGASYARLARAHGAELPAARIEEAFGRIWRAAAPMPAGAGPDAAAAERAWWRGIARDTFRAADSSVRFDDFEACFDALWLHYSGAAAWRPRSGSASLLDGLRRRGLATAVVSNFDSRLPGVLDALDLLRRLDALVLPRDAGASKPDPRIFELALSRLGVAAEQALYVGDDPERDVAAARRAGLRAIGVDRLAKLDALTRGIG